MSKLILNLGCGDRFHQDHINLDLHSSHPSVKAHNLTKGIPYPNSFFDAVYHSHFLEHLPKDTARFLLKECHRVLKEAGIIRIVIPDLEQKAILYLDALRRCLSQNDLANEDHEWMILELIDQMVRIRPEGEMKEFLKTKNISENEFILKRIGIDWERIQDTDIPSSSLLLRMKNMSILDLVKKIYQRLSKGMIGFLAYIILGSRGRESWEIGWFKTSGEVHQWMYDRVSLTRLILEAGFSHPIITDHATSQIDNWPLFLIDQNPDGSPYKPDSLYLEGHKI